MDGLDLALRRRLQYHGDHDSDEHLRMPQRHTQRALSGIQSYNYVANFGNTAITAWNAGVGNISTNTVSVAPAQTYNGFTYAGAPFSDIILGAVRLADIIDGTSNTLFNAEVIQGQDKTGGSTYDLRGFVHWWEGEFFETSVLPNTSVPDQMSSASYCIYPFMTNPPALPRRITPTCTRPGAVTPGG